MAECEYEGSFCRLVLGGQRWRKVWVREGLGTYKDLEGLRVRRWRPFDDLKVIGSYHVLVLAIKDFKRTSCPFARSLATVSLITR